MSKKEFKQLDDCCPGNLTPWNCHCMFGCDACGASYECFVCGQKYSATFVDDLDCGYYSAGFAKRGQGLYMQPWFKEHWQDDLTAMMSAFLFYIAQGFNPRWRRSKRNGHPVIVFGSTNVQYYGTHDPGFVVWRGNKRSVVATIEETLPQSEFPFNKEKNQ